MSERKLYEIAHMMSDKEIIEQDMREAAELVSAMFRDKYIKRLDEALKKCRDSHIKNPSREVMLVNSMKAFMPEENHKSMDNLAEIIMMMETLNNIQKEAGLRNGRALRDDSANNNSRFNEKKLSAASVEKTEDINRVEAAQYSADFSAMKKNISDSAVHDDGIYEIDKNCMLKKGHGIPTGIMSIILAQALK